MLEITGFFNNELVQEKMITADQAIQEYNLPINGQSKLVFRLNEDNPHVVAVNKADGKPRWPTKFGLDTTFSGMYNGSPVTIRYYETKDVRDKNKPRYFPREITIEGIQQSFRLPDQKEMAVYVMLYGLCANSPLRNKNITPAYKLYDRVKNANASIEANMQFAALMETIMKTPDDMVCYIAHAARVKGRKVSSDDAREPATARLGLLELARYAPGELQKAFYSRDVQILGAVMHARAKGKISMKSRAGKHIWSYSDDHNREVFAELAESVRPAEELAKFLHGPKEWGEFITKVGGGGPAPGVEDATELESVSLEEMDPVNLVRLAVDAQVIALARDESKVYTMNSKGQFDDRALMVVKGELDDWKSELAQNMSQIVRNRIIKKLK